MKKRMEAEKKVDATVFEYDEQLESLDRKPKYISGLLNSAATRRLDYLRAEEKLMHREREAEGDEFADKESFVTQAYKDQMAAVRAAEEEEKKRDELLKKQGGGSSGMAHFYRKLLEDSEQKHEATVAATQKPVIGPKAREEGKEVELNDDNQIVDKRDLLVAGLNLSAPNTRKLGERSNMIQGKNGEEVQAHRAVGTAATRREINERRAREIQQQMEAEGERLQREKQERILRQHRDFARERYRERKRQRLETDEQVKPDD
ncbi:coiled-coil domain-containing protein 55-domain containing protein [Mycena galopus ATCC 62051]|nr:coiled-coil domain-containing protein 55-domain containing protein [Mycena galopus ATCC 62051]